MFTPDEYPALKADGKVTLKKPSPTKLSIVIDRGEKVIHEPTLTYIDQLNAEIAALQTQINNRLLLITDIQATP